MLTTGSVGKTATPACLVDLSLNDRIALLLLLMTESK